MDLLIGLGIGVGLNYLNFDNLQKGGTLANLWNQDDDENVIGPPSPSRSRQNRRQSHTRNPKYIPPGPRLPVLYKSRVVNGVTEFFDGARGWRNAEEVRLENNIKECSNRCKRSESARKINKAAKKKLNRKRKREVKEMVCVFHKKSKEKEIQFPVVRKVYNYMASLIQL